MKQWTLGFAAMLGAAAGGTVVKKLWLAKYREQKAELECAEQESGQLHSWLQLEQHGLSITKYFNSNNYKSIAILGMGRTGRLLADALGDMAVYGVELDNPNAVHERFTVYRLGDDPLPPADCMVICDFENIPEKVEKIKAEFSGDIVTLDKVLISLREEI